MNIRYLAINIEHYLQEVDYMRTMQLGSSNLEVPVIAVGCMRLKSLTPKEAEVL